MISTYYIVVGGILRRAFVTSSCSVASLSHTGGPQTDFASEFWKFPHLEGEFPHGARRPQSVNHTPFLGQGGLRVCSKETTWAIFRQPKKEKDQQTASLLT